MRAAFHLVSGTTRNGPFRGVDLTRTIRDRLVQMS